MYKYQIRSMYLNLNISVCLLFTIYFPTTHKFVLTATDNFIERKNSNLYAKFLMYLVYVSLSFLMSCM